MFCSKCGQKLEDAYCANCGASAESADKPNGPTAEKVRVTFPKKTLVIAGIVALIVVAGAIVAFAPPRYSFIGEWYIPPLLDTRIEFRRDGFFIFIWGDTIGTWELIERIPAEVRNTSAGEHLMRGYRLWVVEGSFSGVDVVWVNEDWMVFEYGLIRADWLNWQRR